MGITRIRKEQEEDICKGTPDVEFEQDWSIGLGATLSDGQKIKNYFSSLRNFLEKVNSVILFGFESTINSQNLIKIIGSIFDKFEILNFFLVNYP